MSDADYRIDGLESRISSLEGDLSREISDRRYDTETEISSVRGKIRDLEDTVHEKADSASYQLTENEQAIEDLRAQLHVLRESVATLSLRCGVTVGTVKLSVDRGEDGGS